MADAKAAPAAGASGSQAPSGSGTNPSALARSAALSSAELEAAERQAQAADAAATASASPTALADLKPGEIATKSAYNSGAVARKAAAVRIPVYRFFNGSTGAHFFTTSASERDNVVNTLSPPFSLEGEAFSVANAYSPGLSPVHRFYNTQTGVHFYTISEAERANVVATLPHFNYEGVAYYASQVAGAGLVPFYRFYVPNRGFHFYTANEGEKNSIIATLAATYSYEGVGYYVLASNWRAEKLPHTGINSNQCYEASGNTLVNCAGVGAVTLNVQQDGHRAAINPLSYSQLVSGYYFAYPLALPLYYPNTDCVRDNVSGLVWEGKTASGTRSGTNTYSNHGDGRVGDASAYVNMVNALKHCGFSDWRLPTRNELLTIVDYGRGAAPNLNTAWFLNTAAEPYWSSDSYQSAPASAWVVNFSTASGGSSTSYNRLSSLGVRLVRGNAFNGQRFSYSSVAYGSDGANNVVNDAWTGLQWRRCEEGRVWSGSLCIGTANGYNHSGALAHAKTQAGWRLPNIKELSSLTDLGEGTAGFSPINASAFPGAESLTVWSSSPDLGATYNAWAVTFLHPVSGYTYGAVFGRSRNNTTGVRLVLVP